MVGTEGLRVRGEDSGEGKRVREGEREGTEGQRERE